MTKSQLGGFHPTSLKGLPCSFGRSLTLTPSLTEQASSDEGAFRRQEVKMYRGQRQEDCEALERVLEISFRAHRKEARLVWREHLGMNEVKLIYQN